MRAMNGKGCQSDTYRTGNFKEVFRDCKGVAVFHVLRPELQPELHKSGAGGSGIVVAKKADGEWSCPSVILVRTGKGKEVGFPDGVDCLDVVCVIDDFAGMKGVSDPS